MGQTAFQEHGAQEYPVKIEIRHSGYPSHVKDVMGKRAPAALYMLGNLDLLRLPGIGICGSRKATPTGLNVAKDYATQLAEKNVVVIAGNAGGIDAEAHFSSLSAGGNTILVLPEGINNFRIRKNLKSVWNRNNVLVISQFEPQAIWRVSRAMERNNLIIALSRGMIVVEAGETGGTLNAGQRTLKYGLPLFVAEYEEASASAQGNAILIREGGQKIARNAHVNRANLAEVFEQMDENAIPAGILV